MFLTTKYGKKRRKAMNAKEIRQISKGVLDRQRYWAEEITVKNEDENKIITKEEQEEINHLIKLILIDIEKAAYKGLFFAVFHWVRIPCRVILSQDKIKNSLNLANQVCTALSQIGFSASAFMAEGSFQSDGFDREGFAHFDIEFYISWFEDIGIICKKEKSHESKKKEKNN